MNRREFMGGAFLPQIAGIRQQQSSSRVAIAAPVRVQGECSTPGCGEINTQTVRDVLWSDKSQSRCVATPCLKCSNIYAIWNSELRAEAETKIVLEG